MRALNVAGTTTTMVDPTNTQHPHILTGSYALRSQAFGTRS